MSDVGTGIALLGAAIGSKELIQKILGPTADYLGDGLKSFTQKRIENVAKIFAKAEKKIGARISDEGAVPSRILKEIIDDGSFIEDELSAEYFAGILASSRSGLKRDDRTISALKQVQTMSTYEIRTHYIFYRLVRQLFLGDKLLISEGSHKFVIFVPFTVYFSALDLSKEEKANVVVSHAIVGLNDKGLIQNYCFGKKEFLTKNGFKDIREDGIVFSPTPAGAQLFLLTSGIKDRHENELISDKIQVDDVEGVLFESGSKRLK